ncbi:uncharacterized protein BDZ99DRAFT_260197 [Mytilinidion resinicola]|uniref:Uncharacterized protein n=1 Tax=Mytilinidion resinicola TaxID=574789 RepID=A0A6A6YU28_9PEZI|nr:uncharacterized protein BDZ99DRAFT_260197 [Mytilinidion resinicola]KAF2812048.1 hypothetical protein BDZ99DRAFT_260197 [Mytilinidion resinicola]
MSPYETPYNSPNYVKLCLNIWELTPLMKRNRPIGRRTLSVDPGLAELLPDVYGKDVECKGEMRRRTSTLRPDEYSNDEYEGRKEEKRRRKSEPSLPATTWDRLDGNNIFKPTRRRDSGLSPHNPNTSSPYKALVPPLEAYLQTNLPLPTATQDSSGPYTALHPFIRRALHSDRFNIRTHKYELSFYEPYYGPREHAIRADDPDIPADRTIPSPVKLPPQSYNRGWRQREEYKEERRRQREKQEGERKGQWERRLKRIARVRARWGSASQWQFNHATTLAYMASG